jgi:hypothetical protein
MGMRWGREAQFINRQLEGLNNLESVGSPTISETDLLMTMKDG